MPIRLVKGAYWDVETVEAKAHNFEAPQFLNKEETDIHFRQVVSLALENGDFIQLAVASHNIQDHCFSEALRSELYPNSPLM
jgi:RHH-type proline utilization regulon transcriptional repressor/proline dehydrogenase/delta 1-pyrroline-5-carboxylate dehydrogenase